jgi:hypothetical protein
LGKPEVSGEHDALEIVLTPDLPPYGRQYRLLPKGLGAFPNLPRVTPAAASDSLAAMLQDLGVGECHAGEAEQADRLLMEPLVRALEINGIKVPRSSGR